jgi:hypothetical protein
MIRLKSLLEAINDKLNLRFYLSEMLHLKKIITLLKINSL